MPTDYGFTGQKFDASDGLMYYGARYYDAALGRFISADTIVPSTYNPQALNRYSYVLNNPVRYVDPSGHCPIDEETGGCERDNNGNVIVGVDQKEYGEPPPDKSLDSCKTASCWGVDPSESTSFPNPINWTKLPGPEEFVAINTMPVLLTLGGGLFVAATVAACDTVVGCIAAVPMLVPAAVGSFAAAGFAADAALKYDAIILNGVFPGLNAPSNSLPVDRKPQSQPDPPDYPLWP